MTEHEHEHEHDDQAPDDDQPDDDQPDQPDPDEEAAAVEAAAPAPAPPSEREMERRFDQLSREETRHAKRVAEIMGDDFDHLIPSPLDWTPGYLWNPELVPVADEARAATLALLGIAGPDEFRDDPEKERCGTCDGRGMLRTGSLVAGQDALPCSRCRGQGWQAIVQPVAAVVTMPGTTQTAGTATYSNTEAAPAVQPMLHPDPWGRPQGHPHYGMSPASVGAS